MTNADKINSMAMYDLLMLMNENITAQQQSDSLYNACVLDGFNHDANTCDGRCSECLQRFLAADYDGRW